MVDGKSLETSLQIVAISYLICFFLAVFPLGLCSFFFMPVIAIYGIRDKSNHPQETSDEPVDDLFFGICGVLGLLGILGAVLTFSGL
jgi:hypothetical protein